MNFVRQPTDIWQRDIPGARWFKADLHVHTIDDHPGGRAVPPAELSGNELTDPHLLSRYATLFLRGAISNGVQIIGLTPHSPRTGGTPETSAVWRIVDEWNCGIDDDGIPFREKIYAIFPGFEPNINDGASGIHLLFLFDPEIGRDRYLSLFDAIMDGRHPWKHSALRPTQRDAGAILDTLDRGQSESLQSDAPWHYMALSPHFQGAHGILHEMRSKVLERFPLDRLGGYELGDDKLPSDFSERKKPGKFLRPFMDKHRQAFFHASDAYSIKALGQRHTWVKLASPCIEALRQAFVANDSRMRIGFERGDDGEIRPISDTPDVTLHQRPWLNSVNIRGAASFFGAKGSASALFRLSPDLTCIIGGSMTGKSTFLDGLRVHVEAPSPNDATIRDQVLARGRNIFGAGSPVIKMDCPGRDPTAPLHEQWPAQFFAQNELQRLSSEASAVEGILARLVPSETQGIEERNRELAGLDEQLRGIAKRLCNLDESLAEAEQAHARAENAKSALDAFAEAGVESLHQASRDRQQWVDTKQVAEGIRADIQRVVPTVSSLDIPESEHIRTASALPVETETPDVGNLAKRWNRIDAQVKRLERDLEHWLVDADRIVTALQKHQDERHLEVERALAERGLDAGKLREIQEINRQAALLPSYASNLEQTRQDLRDAEDQFARVLARRRSLVDQQRMAFDRVMFDVDREFAGRIRVRRTDNGDFRPLDTFLRDLKQTGVTRWWNDLDEHQKPSSDKLNDALGLDIGHKIMAQGLASQNDPDPPPVDHLGRVGMSSTVRATFRECMTGARRRDLRALRCPDRYFLELRMDDGSYRRLDELSGGQRVSVLLSLLLETDDTRPLVIDQPEDELDNRFLFETVLPALKRLKGRRQVIVATHDANIVVNGDADMVIQLDATASHGRVACSGAIEEPAIRNAIVRTVDGGKEAFRLRQYKYGF